MSTRPFLRTTPDLPQMVAEHGIEAVADQIDQYVTAQRCAGACTLLLNILADRTQPAVARERALGRLWGTVPARDWVSARVA